MTQAATQGTWRAASIAVVTGISMAAGAACFQQVFQQTACQKAGWTPGAVPCGTGTCSDILIADDPIFNIASRPQGFDQFTLGQSDCIIQRKKCAIPPGGSTLACLAAGVFTSSHETLLTTGDACGGGGGEP